MRILAAFLSILPLSLAAQEAAPKPAIHEVSPGVFELGAIRLEQKTRTITFPAEINMDKGAVEYLLVGHNGPTHESLLATDVSPAELNTVLLLLGAKGMKPAGPGAAAPPGQLNAEYLKHAPKLSGDMLIISATWKDKGGDEKTVEVADWLYFLPSKKAPPRGPWLYTGSQFGADGKFLAEVEDIFASLVTNPAALLNNPRKGSDDDRLWEVNDKVVPPAKTPLTVSIRFPAPAAK